MKTSISIEYQPEVANDLLRLLLEVIPKLINLGMKITVMEDEE